MFNFKYNISLICEGVLLFLAATAADSENARERLPFLNQISRLFLLLGYPEN